MKQQNRTSLLIQYSKKQRQASSKFAPKESDEAYQSYFFRNSTQESSLSPSQSSKPKRVEGTQSKRSDRRSSIYNKILKQFELTHKNQVENLRQQNNELKKTIAELKISSFYKLDEVKIKTILLDLHQTKQQLTLSLQKNESLRLQNDFLSRANIQLRLQMSKIVKSAEGQRNQKALALFDKNCRSVSSKDKIFTFNKIDNPNKPPQSLQPLQIVEEKDTNDELSTKKSLKMSCINSQKNKETEKSCKFNRVKKERLLMEKLQSQQKKSWLRTEAAEE